ncbi:MAG: phytanoyl-CoA dioxygenase family protein [Chitinophagaceae bacterium]|nr:phytanoyl-CoA dioxygenase family protein [Chitinophagaceae bacterium]
MEPIFKNKQTQQDFEKDGYVIVKLIDKNEIHVLKDFYENSQIKKNKNEVFYVGSDNENKSLVDNMTDYILENVTTKLDVVLQNYKAITASYIIKYPTPNGTINPHQDWSFVDDEKNYCSMTCWIPLVDVDIQTGCMGAIKGSHHFFSNVRPSPMPFVETPLTKHNNLLISYLHMLPMKAGEALFFNHRAVHASLPNTTKINRTAVGIAIANSNAQMVHYYLNPKKKNQLNMYKSDVDFYKRYDNFLLQQYFKENKTLDNETLLGEKEYVFENYSTEELKKLLAKYDNTETKDVKNYLTKLKYIYAYNNLKERFVNLFKHNNQNAN